MTRLDDLIVTMAPYSWKSKFEEAVDLCEKLENELAREQTVVIAAGELMSFLNKCVPQEIELRCSDVAGAGLAERLDTLAKAFRATGR